MDHLFRRRHGRASQVRRAMQERLQFGATGPRVLANSVPKAGTHLLARCLEQFPGVIDSGVHIKPETGAVELEATLDGLSPGSFATAHLPYAHPKASLLVAAGVKHTLIVRDPRDVVVSHFYYVTHRATNHPLHAYYRDLPDDSARLMASIQGVDAASTGLDKGLENVGLRFHRYLHWRDHDACLVRFRNLIGPRGSGSRTQQTEEIQHLATHLEVELGPRDLERVLDRAFFDKSTTFRRGAIGDWKNHFAEKHKAAFKEMAGPILIDLGYEKDLNW